MEYLDWLEKQFADIEPGTVVEYKGSLEKAHGLWVVRVQVDKDYYTLSHPLNEWERLNANRADISLVEPAKELDNQADREDD